MMAMNQLKLRRVLPICSVMFLIFQHLVLSPVSAAEIRYSNPQVKGYALDLCQQWGRHCGKPAASAYCRSKGYKRATKFGVRRDTPPTRVIGSGDICKSPSCDRILWVKCAVDKVYRNPKVRGYALDYCKQWGTACGKPAADQFCKAKGHTRSVDFAARFDSPPTRVISSGKVCTGGFCDRIVAVACEGRRKVGSEGGGKKDAGGDSMMASEDDDELIFDDEDGYK